jgi:hypothetical protein
MRASTMTGPGVDIGQQTRFVRSEVFAGSGASKVAAGILEALRRAVEIIDMPSAAGMR